MANAQDRRVQGRPSETFASRVCRRCKRAMMASGSRRHYQGGPYRRLLSQRMLMAQWDCRPSPSRPVVRRHRDHEIHTPRRRRDHLKRPHGATPSQEALKGIGELSPTRHSRLPSTRTPVPKQTLYRCQKRTTTSDYAHPSSSNASHRSSAALAFSADTSRCAKSQSNAWSCWKGWSGIGVPSGLQWRGSMPRIEYERLE